MDCSSPFSTRSNFNDIVMKCSRNSLSRIKRVGIIQDPFFDLGEPVFFIESKFIVQPWSLKIKIDGNNLLPELRKIFCYIGNCESSPNSTFIRVESDGLQRDPYHIPAVMREPFSLISLTYLLISIVV